MKQLAFCHFRREKRSQYLNAADGGGGLRQYSFNTLKMERGNIACDNGHIFGKERTAEFG